MLLAENQRKDDAIQVWSNYYGLWQHHENNTKISHAKLALDFSAKYNRPISKSTVTRILTKKSQISDVVSVVPKMELMCVKRLLSANRAKFENISCKPFTKKFRRPRCPSKTTGLRVSRLSTSILYFEIIKKWKKIFHITQLVHRLD